MAKETVKVDVAVIGGGPGGYTAAFRAADLGLTVALIEGDPRLGGTCLLRGCIPSKALLHVAHILHETKVAKDWGITFPKPKIDIDGLREWKESIIKKLSAGIADLQKRRKVIPVHGWASFESSSALTIDGDATYGRVEFDKAIIASGSIPVQLPGTANVSKELLIDSTGALDLADIPKKLLVVGGGVIALELGQVYAELGSKVTVVELTEGLLPGVDRDLVKPLQDRLSSIFEGIYVNTKVVQVDEHNGKLKVKLEGDVAKKTQTFDKVLCAIGRRPKTDHLKLDQTKVTVDARGYIEVNKTLQTQDPNIYAIGDAAPGPMLAHKAAAEGRIAAEVIAGEWSEFDHQVIPGVVYTDPEVAWCGLTETEAKKQGKKIAVGRFPWAASGRNLALGRGDGLTKVIMDPKTERVLGMGIVGYGAGELLAEGVLAIEMAAVAHDVAGTIHAHPSLSETVSGSIEVFLGSITDLYVPKRRHKD